MRGRHLSTLNTGKLQRTRCWVIIFVLLFNIYFPQNVLDSIFSSRGSSAVASLLVWPSPPPRNPASDYFIAAVIVPGNTMSRRHDRKQQQIHSTALWSPLIVLICARQHRHTANGTCLTIRAVVQSLIFLSKSIWRHGSRTVWQKEDKKFYQKVYQLVLLNGHELLCFIPLFVHSGCNAAPTEFQKGISERKFLKVHFFPIGQTWSMKSFFFLFFNITYADLSRPDSKPADDKGINIIMLL